MGLLAVQKFTEDHLASLLRDMFKGIKLRDRLSVRMVDDSIAIVGTKIQKIGDSKKTYEIYFDNEFVSSFDDTMNVVKIDRDFLFGFLELYQDKTIFINQEMYEERDKQLKYEKLMADTAKEVQREKDMANLSTDEKSVAHELFNQIDGKK